MRLLKGEVSLNGVNFNPRTHRGVRLSSSEKPFIGCEIFQSTHPSWGATRCKVINVHSHGYFNPRTHRGVRPHVSGKFSNSNIISIHAPIVGCDLFLNRQSQIQEDNFNPRTHRGVRQNDRCNFRWRRCISIHAPIVGCDEA